MCVEFSILYKRASKQATTYGIYYKKAVFFLKKRKKLVYSIRSELEPELLTLLSPILEVIFLQNHVYSSR